MNAAASPWAYTGLVLIAVLIAVCTVINRPDLARRRRKPAKPSHWQQVRREVLARPPADCTSSAPINHHPAPGRNTSTPRHPSTEEGSNP